MSTSVFRRRCVYLASTTVLLAGAGIVFAIRADRIPYGALAPQALGFCLALGAIPAALLVRAWRRSSPGTPGSITTLFPDQLPSREGLTFLGRGFDWTPGLSVRLRDSEGGGSEAHSSDRDFEPGNHAIHGIGRHGETDLLLPDSVLTQHLLVLGAPGTGKTRLLELLVEQAVRRGDAVVVIDPKGDDGLLDRTCDAARQAGRMEDFRFFALPYPYDSARYNPLAHYIRVSEVTDRIAMVLPRGGGDAEAFRNFAWEFTNNVATALDMLGEPITVSALETYCLNNRQLLVQKLLVHLYPELYTDKALADALNDYKENLKGKEGGNPALDRLLHMSEIDDRYFEKVSSALRPVFAKLLSPGVGYLLSPEHVQAPKGLSKKGPGRELAWSTIDRDRQVVYFFLGSLLGAESANGVARMILADLQGYLGRKFAYEHARGSGRITVIIDEAGDVIAPESINLLNKARGAELSMCLAGQSLADLEVALRSRAEAHRALANVGTLISLRTANPEDAKYVSEKCGRRPTPVHSESEMYEPALFSSGRQYVDDFAYRNSRSVTTRDELLVPPHLLGQLPRFHFFMESMGAVRKGVLPLLTAPAESRSRQLKAGEDLQ